MNEKNHKVRVNKIAINRKISDHLVEQVVKDYMEWVYDKMQDEELYPDVKIPYFGRFGLNYKKLRNKLRNKIKKYKKGEITREECVKFVSHYRPIYRRLVEYKFRSKRYRTFNGKRIKRKKPLWWEKKYFPEQWPEED